jgi:hypothetical protein
MPALSPQPQDSNAIVAIVLFLACICVIYWRFVLRVIVIILVALAIYGTFEGLHGLDHLTR